LGILLASFYCNVRVDNVQEVKSRRHGSLIHWSLRQSSLQFYFFTRQLYCSLVLKTSYLAGRHDSAAAQCLPGVPGSCAAGNSKSGHFKADQLMFVLNHLQLPVPNLGLVSFSIAKRTAALQHALARRCHWFFQITSTE
jgi:hypothetical protein